MDWNKYTKLSKAEWLALPLPDAKRFPLGRTLVEGWRLDYSPEPSQEETLASQESPVPDHQLGEAMAEVKEWVKTL